jgi:hypothetical protein
MANRAYLVQSLSAVLAEYDPDRDILAAASYCVPVFWYALLDESSILNGEIALDDGTTAQCPYLLTTVVDARARFTARMNQIFMVIPQTFRPLADEFCRMFDSLEGTHLHIDAVELWMMDESDVFLVQVRKCLSAFDGDALSGILAAIHRKSKWRELLRQVDIDFYNVAASTEPHKLTGYGWVRPVTWKE